MSGVLSFSLLWTSGSAAPIDCRATGSRRPLRLRCSTARRVRPGNLQGAVAAPCAGVVGGEVQRQAGRHGSVAGQLCGFACAANW